MDFTQIKQSLLKLVEDREFTFKDTDSEVADKYLENLKIFKGIADSEILKLEQQCHGRFSRSFRKYLKELGLNCGRLFTVSTRCPADKTQEEIKEQAQELIDSNDLNYTLESTDFVFLCDDGFSFTFIKARGEIDTKVYYFEEGETEIEILGNTFEEFLEMKLNTLEQFVENVKNNGGCHLTVDPDGSVTMDFSS